MVPLASLALSSVTKSRGPVLLKDAPLPEFLFVVSCLCLLSFIGGFVNGMCIAGIFKMGLTHLTGVSTNMGTTIGVEQDFRPFDFFFSFIAAFIGGTCGGALLIDVVQEKKVKEFGFGHALCFAAESVVLWTIYGLLANGTAPTPGFAWPTSFRLAATLVPFAMGLQASPTGNLTYGTFRTSMMTGAVAEIGLSIALIAREGHRGHVWRLFNVFILLFFWMGTVAGSVAWLNYPKDVAAIPAFMMTVVAAVAVAVTNVKRKRDRERERMNPPRSPVDHGPCHMAAGTTEGSLVEAMSNMMFNGRAASVSGEGGAGGGRGAKVRSGSATAAELEEEVVPVKKVLPAKKNVDTDEDKDFV